MNKSSVFAGLFLIALGCVFLASYYFGRRSFLLRQIASLLDYNPILSRKMAAFFYFGLATICGIGAILQGLGLFPHLEGFDPIWGLLVVLLIIAVPIAVRVLRSDTDHPRRSGQ